jgi:hypothetical protein
MSATVTTLIAEPELEALSLVAELAELERPAWAGVSAGIPAWHPRAEGDADADDDDEAAGSAGSTGAGADDDEDDDEDETTNARKAAAAANREVKRLKAEQAKAAEKAKAEAGKWQELYEEAKRELEDLKGTVEREGKERHALAALAKLKAKNPARAVKLMDLDDVDDEASAERAAKRLLKSDDYLFDTTPTRQKRGAGAARDEDDDDDQPKRPVNRLRRGLEASAA